MISVLVLRHHLRQDLSGNRYDAESFETPFVLCDLAPYMGRLLSVFLFTDTTVGIALVQNLLCSRLLGTSVPK